MGIIRNTASDMPEKNAGRMHGAGGVTVKCPKCQGNIVISRMNGREPVRCAKCHYAMVRGTDLQAIVAACRKLANPNQTDSAVGILKHMIDYVPEAGTAIGVLASKYPLPISEGEKWSLLNSAYAGGDENAREWLNLMCQTSPDKYQQRTCAHCGAVKYIDRQDPVRSLCVFCRRAD